MAACYAAFLRGVNLGAKNKIAMAELKKAMEAAGFRDVVSVLNSGNLLFSAEGEGLREKLEALIEEKFALKIPVYLIWAEELKDILAHAPSFWGTDDKDRYDNLIFILSEDSPEEILALLGEASEGLEESAVYKRVIFWTFDRKRYQKCAWWKKTAAPGIAEKLTIRTAGTLKKLCAKIK